MSRSRSMSLSVTVLNGFKEFKYKVNASTLLFEVLQESCVYFHISNIEQYGLKHGSSQLDLSLPFRFANIPQGCRLDLVKSAPGNEIISSLPIPAEVTIRLQIIAPECDSSFKHPLPSELIEKFNSYDTFIQILKKYQEKTGIMLLNRECIYDNLKLNKRIFVKYVPQIQILSKLLTTEDELNTKLELFGMSSGNHNIRLKFKKLETGAEDLKTVTEDDSVIKPRANSINLGEKELEKVDADANSKLENIQLKSKVKNEKTIFRDQEFTPALESEEISKEYINEYPNIEVYKPITTAPIPRYQHEESVYEMSVDQAQIYQKLLSKQAGSAAMITKSQREKLDQKYKLAIKECIIRIKFPDGQTVQLTLDARRTLKDLYDVLVHRVLKLNEEITDGNIFFELYIPYPHTILLDKNSDLTAGLLDSGFGHRTLLSYKDTSDSGGKKQYISDKYLSKAKTLNDLEEVKLEAQRGELDDDSSKKSTVLNKSSQGPSSSSSSSSATDKKVPAWLKLSKK